MERAGEGEGAKPVLEERRCWNSLRRCLIFAQGVIFSGAPWLKGAKRGVEIRCVFLRLVSADRRLTAD